MNWDSTTLILDFIGFICISLYIWFGLKPITYTETYQGIMGDYTLIIKAINNLIDASGFLNLMRFGFIIITFSFFVKFYKIFCDNKDDKMIGNDYYISISKEKFELLKNNQKFLKTIILSRIINALRFCQMLTLLPASNNESTYARMRHRINVPLFTSSVLYEGFRFAEKALETDKDFKEMEVYKKGIGAIINDDGNKKLINNRLSIIRNRFVFHFDQKHIEKTEQYLRRYNSDAIIFASACGEAGGNMYYVLADEFFINYLIDPKGTKIKDDLREQWKAILQDTLKLMKIFTEETEKLIAEVLLQLGLTVDTGAIR